MLSHRLNTTTAIPFLAWPLFGSLLFPNLASDCRDHCANERTFLSWLRLSTYLAVVAVAIVISFHLKHQPTPLELRISLPVGIVFWVLSLASLASGLANYIRTITRYSRRQALVQSGWKTQIVSGSTVCLISSPGAPMVWKMLDKSCIQVVCAD